MLATIGHDHSNLKRVINSNRYQQKDSMIKPESGISLGSLSTRNQIPLIIHFQNKWKLQILPFLWSLTVINTLRCILNSIFCNQHIPLHY